MSLGTIFGIVVGLGFIFYKMISKSLETQNKTGLAITGITMVLVAMVIVAVAGGAGHKQTDKQEYVPPSSVKTVEEKMSTPTPNSRAMADYERQADERRRQQEEQYATREAELAASRMSIEDFDWRLMENVNVFVDAAGLNHVDHMGTPERHAEGIDETLTYPLDLDGDLSITEITKDGKIKGARITVHQMNQESMLAAVVFYNALVQVFVTSGEANSIFYGLHLDETFFDDGKNTRTVNHKGYRYEKRFSGNKLLLSIAEQ